MNRESFSAIKCICGNPVNKVGKRCKKCQREEILESDGHGYKSGRKDNSDTWVIRFEKGIELENLAYNDQ